MYPYKPKKIKIRGPMTSYAGNLSKLKFKIRLSLSDLLQNCVLDRKSAIVGSATVGTSPVIVT